MRSAAKKIRKNSQREAARVKRQGAPEPVSEDEDPEVHFRLVMDCPESTPLSPPASPVSQGETDYGLVLDTVQKLKGQLNTLNLIMILLGPPAMLSTNNVETRVWPSVT